MKKDSYGLLKPEFYGVVISKLIGAIHMTQHFKLKYYNSNHNF